MMDPPCALYCLGSVTASRASPSPSPPSLRNPTSIRFFISFLKESGILWKALVASGLSIPGQSIARFRLAQVTSPVFSFTRLTPLDLNSLTALSSAFFWVLFIAADAYPIMASPVMVAKSPPEGAMTHGIHSGSCPVLRLISRAVLTICLTGPGAEAQILPSLRGSNI